MKAQVITEFGAPSVFRSMDVPSPVLKPGHVILRVSASSVNQLDCKIRSGALPAIAPDFPAILQGDVAGTVTAVASDVTEFNEGDEVYGYAGGVRGLNGALAEFMLVDARLIAKKPVKLSMSEAAALPLVTVTAWEALFLKANLKANQSVLIHGGLGGVGHIAVQLAKSANAKIYTTVISNEDIPKAKALGADEVINAKEEKTPDYVQRLTGGKGFEIIFDTVGGPNLDGSLAAAGLNGTVVTTAARSTHDLTSLHNKGLTLHGIFVANPLLFNQGRAAHSKILAEASKLVDAGKLIPIIDPHAFTFEQVTEAHSLLESGKAHGKIVLTQN